MCPYNCVYIPTGKVLIKFYEYHVHRFCIHVLKYRILSRICIQSMHNNIAIKQTKRIYISSLLCIIEYNTSNNTLSIMKTTCLMILTMHNTQLLTWYINIPCSTSCIIFRDLQALFCKP